MSWLLAAALIFAVGAWEGRNWGNREPATAPPSVQAPAPGWDYYRPLCAELANHQDPVVRRRACEK